MPNERLFPVEGLPVPNEMPAVNQPYESQELFLERAGRVLGTMDGLQEEMPAIWRICHAVAGIPIALELSAGIITHKSPTEIATAIAKDLDSLAGTMKDVPHRQRTIRTIFEHSWQLLSPSAQTALMQLAIFPASFDRAAVNAVTHTTPDDLAILLRQALVGEDEVQERMRLHPLVHQFALEKLTDTDLAGTTRHQHARYFTDFLMRYHLHFATAKQKEALDQIAQEIENVRQCWHTIYTLPEMTIMLPAVKVIYLFLLTKGWVVELESLLTQAKETLAQSIGLPSELHGETARIVGKLYHFHGWVTYRLGRLQQAETILFDSLHHFIRIEALPETAAVQHHLGTLLRNRGKYEQALVHANEALRLWKELDRPRTILNSLVSVGNTYAIKGDLPQAQACLLEAYEIVQEMELPILQAAILNDLGEVVMALPDYESARRYFVEALPIYRHHQEMMGVGMTLYNLAQVSYHLGDHEGAVQYAEESQVICQELQNPRMLSYPLCTLALVATAKGDLAEGLRLFQSALSLASKIGYKPKMALILVDMAEWMVQAGDLETAAMLYAYAIQELLLKSIVRERAGESLQRLGERMPASSFATATKKGKNIPLEDIAQRMLAYG